MSRSAKSDDLDLDAGFFDDFSPCCVAEDVLEAALVELVLAVDALGADPK
jgi:hypothetical protein